MSVETNDSDQSLFASQHPKEASQGMRLFSLDGYANSGVDPAGHATQQHFTFALFSGEPSYDTVREKFIAIAQKKLIPLSSRTGLTRQ